MIRILLLAVAIGSSIVTVLADAEPRGERRAMPVLEAIRQLEAGGNLFVYSTDLVQPSSIIELPASTSLSVDVFRAALDQIGLTLNGSEEADGSVIWYVVRKTPPQTRPPLEGRVTDAESGAPLVGVKVEIAGAVLFTDEIGRFWLPEDWREPVRLSLSGYESRQVEINHRLDRALEIPLAATQKVEEIVVVTSRYSLPVSDPGSIHRLTAGDMENIPEFGDDTLRVASHLPGMASQGLSARPYVRGGLQDETLVLFNNVELLEPFHLKDFQSVFSGFNPSMVRSVDVYTGGFPARYGDRMSGVMDIKPASAAGQFGLDVMISFLTASAAVVGSSQDGRGSWAFSARRGNLDLVLDVLDPNAGHPEYADYFGSYRFALSPKNTVEAGFIFYDDDVRLKDINDGDGESAKSIYENGYGWLQLHRSWSERVHSTTVLSFGNLDHARSGLINDSDPEEGSSTLLDQRHIQLWHLGHQQHFLVGDGLSLEIGGRLNYQRGSYDTRALIQRGVLAQLIGGLPATEDRLVRVRPEGTSGSLYGSTRWFLNDQATFEAGLRWDYQDYASEFTQYFSPRLSALFNFGDNTDLRLSAGRFYQPEQIHELPSADGVDRFQPPQFADHYIVGLNHVFGDSGLSVRAEGFYKRFRHPKRRFENLFNPLVLVPELASDRIEVAPERARSRGLELTADYTSVSSKLSAWISYTLAYAEDDLGGDWVQRSWDQRHTVSTGVVWEPASWSLSAVARWHSGWQATLLPSYVAANTLTDLQRNDDRYPEYLSVDLRASRSWFWPRQTLTVFAELTNATNRQNVGGYEYDAIPDGEGGFLLPSEPVTLLPRLPSLGFRWTFK